MSEQIVRVAKALCEKFIHKVDEGRARSHETYAECNSLLNMINKYEQGKRYMMSDKGGITATLTVKLLISNSKDSFSKIDKSFTIKDPEKGDFMAAYGKLVRSVVSSLEFDGETEKEADNHESTESNA